MVLRRRTAALAASSTLPLESITVVATGISNMGAASSGDVTQTQLDSQPLLRPAAIFESIPGMIVTQHSGEGKANQYFLRAFNLDHGTDLALEVDDMPVNTPTHAHGQGYSDFKVRFFRGDDRDYFTLTAMAYSGTWNTYHINPWLSAELNAAFTRARFDHDAAPDDLGCGDAALTNPCTQAIGTLGRYIPNSPTNAVNAGLIAQRESGWFGAQRAKHFGGSPLADDNTARSPADTTVDGRIGLRTAKWLAAIDVFNLANVQWKRHRVLPRVTAEK
jgi:hypothetical protein